MGRDGADDGAGVGSVEKIRLNDHNRMDLSRLFRPLTRIQIGKINKGRGSTPTPDFCEPLSG